MKITIRLVWVIRQRMDIYLYNMRTIDVLFLHGRATIMSKKIVRVYIGYSFFDGLEDSTSNDDGFCKTFKLRRNLMECNPLV